MDEFSDLGSWETCPLSGVFWPAGGLSLRGTWGQRRGFSTRPDRKSRRNPRWGEEVPGAPASYSHPASSGASPRAVPAAPGLTRREQALREHLRRTSLGVPQQSRG